MRLAAPSWAVGSSIFRCDRTSDASAGIPLSRSAFYGSMAVAIMGGLIVATALTLVFLPVLYATWFRVHPEEARHG
jgi:hypothetical protein